MKAANFNSWADFRDYGINFLTGESCGYAMRLLCDVSEKGRELVTSFLGLPYDTKLQPNWNSKVGEADAIGSILLPRGLFKELARYIAFHVLNHAYVLEQADGSVHSYPEGYMEAHGLTIEKARDLLAGSWYTNPAVGRSGTVGGRNVHAMSGRVE